MYRVILIGDEQTTVRTLSSAVKWADHACQVIGTAANAADGIRLIREYVPDIVFTDIQLPDRDGLSMLGSLISELPDLQATVLTGSRDFASAQEAIRLGVTRFLLKPSKPEEIQEALRAMTGKLNRLHPAAQEPPTGSFIVNQAISFMEQNYSTKLTLQDVANHCFVSQWHLSKLLNRQAEKSFYDLLNSIRIEKAKALLQDPSLKIGDIVDMVGFSDSAHFARVFRKLVGFSANEYRNRLK